jgi:hypothetical protein
MPAVVATSPMPGYSQLLDPTDAVPGPEADPGHNNDCNYRDLLLIVAAVAPVEADVQAYSVNLRLTADNFGMLKCH